MAIQVLTYDEINNIIDNLQDAIVEGVTIITDRLKLGDLTTKADIRKSIIYMQQGLRVLETYIYQLDNSDMIYLTEEEIHNLVEQLREGAFYVFKTRKF